MNGCCLSKMSVCGLVVGVCLTTGAAAYAQVVPDTSLGATPSTVSSFPRARRVLVGGGAERGTTLFHSFRDFNVAPNGSVYFINPASIEQIFTRVTGDAPSNLLGTLGILGDADMFFINPNGIVFGPQSRLDMGGSFVASTAESVVFGDGFSFGATTLDTPPLLTVTVPTGLQFGQQPGPISYQTTRNFTNAGLRVEPGKTLALLGGELTFQGASLEATRGRIELGSVAEAGNVAILPKDRGWTFDYGDIQRFDDVTASRTTIATTTEENNRLITSDDQDGDIVIQAADIWLDSSTLVQAGTFTDVPSGDITVNAQRLIMEEGSVLATRAMTNSPENIQGHAGDIVINASDSVVLRGAFDFGGSVLPTSIDSTVRGERVNPQTGVARGIVFGDGGNILINTQQLFLTEGGQIKATSRTAGDAGDVTINAAALVEISGLFQGESRIARSGISGAVTRSGAGGNLVVNTTELRILDGGGLTVEVFGSGDGGSIAVAADVVSLIGTTTPPGKPTFLSAIFARTDAEGDAGRIGIDTRLLELRGGGQISTSARAGSSGSSNLIRVDAAETILVEGGVSAQTGFLPSGLLSNTLGTGGAGLLQLTADELRVENRGRISASTLNPNAQSSGGLDFTVNRLFLENGAEIVVGTFAEAGSGADVVVSDFEVMLLRNGSVITAEAFNSANGGNVRLESAEGFVVAPPGEDSDIIARANFGDGGEIEIVAQSILGLAERPAIRGNGTNDIDASSRFGEAGTVSLNELGTDPTQATAELPDNTGAPDISQECNARAGVSRFVATGRGGSPPETMLPGLLWETLETVGAADGVAAVESAPVETVALREAQSWSVDAAGQVVLTPFATESTTAAIPYGTAPGAHCALTAPAQ